MILYSIFYYIDPSSGSLIINIILSIFLSIGYYFKELLYFKAGKKESFKIAIFSEGNNYYTTFYPLVTELINRKIRFIYYTLDINDKILNINNEFIELRYIGYKFNRSLKFMSIKSDYLISTTPNIGNNKYFLRRPKKVKKLAHVFHSISDIGYYKKKSLENYDIIYMVGSFQRKSIEFVYGNSKIKKTLHNIGLPYYDYYFHRNKINKKVDVEQNQILLAPSWGEKGFLERINYKLIESLSEFEVIIRPHPQSYISDKGAIKNLKTIISKFENCYLDESIDFYEILSKSKILVSDTSSIRFDFSFLFERPVITIKNTMIDLSTFEYDNLKESWDSDKSNEIGKEILIDEIQNLRDIINQFNEVSLKKKIRKLKKETISNIGNSSEKLINLLPR